MNFNFKNQFNKTRPTLLDYKVDYGFILNPLSRRLSPRSLYSNHDLMHHTTIPQNQNFPTHDQPNPSPLLPPPGSSPDDRIAENCGSTSRDTNNFINHHVIVNPTSVKHEILENGYAASPPKVTTPNPLIRAQQSELIPSKNNLSSLSYGQLGLSQKVVQQLKRNLAINAVPTRIEIKKVMDFYPIENGKDVAEFTMTESVTQRLSDPIIHNDIEHVKHALFTANTPLESCSSCFSHQMVTTNQSLMSESRDNINNHSDTHVRKEKSYNSELINSIPSNPQPTQEVVPITNPDVVENPKRERLKVKARRFKPNGLSIAQETISKPNSGIFDLLSTFADEDEYYDGRTHSHPHQKNGPYTCPKCGKVCEISQKFAAHMVSAHYKHESKEEKQKRLQARFRKKRHCLIVTEKGLMMIPTTRRHRRLIEEK